MWYWGTKPGQLQEQVFLNGRVISIAPKIDKKSVLNAP